MMAALAAVAALVEAVAAAEEDTSNEMGQGEPNGTAPLGCLD